MELADKVKAEFYPGDYLVFVVTSLNFKSKEPEYVTFKSVSEVNVAGLWNIFGGIIYSNSFSVTSSYTFKVKCTYINVPIGNENVGLGMYNNSNEVSNARKRIVLINNNNNNLDLL